MRQSQMRDEAIRCARDPAYFIRTHVKIRHPVRGLIPFAMYGYQEAIVANYKAHKRNVVLKPRQMGISEVTAAFVAWLILFHKDQSVLVMATKSETAKNMVKKVRTALKSIPRWMLGKSGLVDLTADNKLSLELNNGSWVKAIATAKDAGRSEALSLLVVDEAAHIEGFDELWGGIKPTVSTGGRIIMLSTPNGVGNVFHATWEGSQDGTGGFVGYQFNWWDNPEWTVGLEPDPYRPDKMTSAKFREETKDLSERLIAQEYELEFLASGATFFSPGQIKLVQEWTRAAIAMDQRIPPLGMDNGYLVVYEPPDPACQYLVTCDVARGDGRDYTTITVWETEAMRQVVGYKGKIAVDNGARLATDIGSEYNTALLVVENNNIGFAFLEHVKTIGYPNVYYSYTRRKEVPGQERREGEAVNTQIGPLSDGLVAGITTGGNNREVMLNKLEELVRLQAITIRDPRVHEEMLTFVWNNRRPEARSGKNDDLILACAFAAWIKSVFIGGQLHTVALQKKMLEHVGVSRTQNTEIHGASKDPRLVPSQAMGSFARQDPRLMYTMRMPDGRLVDLAREFGVYAPRKR